jgi:hypothetical protein
MSDKLSMEGVFRFDDPGTLPPPGPIGRTVRLLIGLALADFVYQWLFAVDRSDLTEPMVLLWTAFSFYLAPYVVNIGFGVRWGAWPRIGLALILAASAGAAFAIDGSWDSDILWQGLRGTQVYLYGHLGISFLLSGVLGTPGCEMRAIPHLIEKLGGSAKAEHYCPGPIDPLDRWERSLRSSEPRDDDED